jgi:cytochrome c556
MGMKGKSAMRRAAVICLGLLLLWAGLSVVPARSRQPNDVAAFMRMKLEHSQKVLEGIAVEDFALIERDSQRLSLLSQAANWQVLQTPDYLQHSLDFRRSADALTKAARDKNLDGAALAYVQMTMNCVNCHKYVRTARLASLNVN